MKFWTVKHVVPMRDYAQLIVMIFVTNVCSNYAFNFHIPMPLYMLFRAGSLIANMVMGIIILKKSYDMWKYVSVVLITVGIIICTISSGLNLNQTVDATDDSNFSVLFWWFVGITLLLISLLVAAILGVYQEKLFRKHGKHPDEALFFTHALPLPFFMLLYNNISTHATTAIESDPYTILGFTLPILVIYHIANMVTNYLCIQPVFVLMSECPSLTVTLVITLRKFASLIFSIFYFQNPFTLFHWLGTLLVFSGTIMFTEIVPQIIQAYTTDTELLISHVN